MTDSAAALKARAQALDAQDPLASYRERFCHPVGKDGAPAIYLCGNSLGLMPKGVRDSVQAELDVWSEMAVDGHFDSARPWYSYHELFTESAAKVVGAKPGEVVIMNSLTTNLHLLMVSFYRPTKERYKILMEPTAFPSDRYAVASQIAFLGFDPQESVVTLQPREGESCLRDEDIQQAIETHGDSLALVLFGGVNYYSGHAYDIAAITQAGHAAGAMVGFDLAHAAGNRKLSLHDDDVDFAVFCTYKYLNPGPGGVGGAYVHERYSQRTDLPRFNGWWGTDTQTRFEMGPSFEPQPGAGAWQLSNAPILSMAALRASLDLFDAAGMDALAQKGEALASFLIDCLDSIAQEAGEGSSAVQLITPREPRARGCQISLRVPQGAQGLHKLLSDRGVVCDFRRPDVIRVAPVPLYNSFTDVWRFAEILREGVCTKAERDQWGKGVAQGDAA